jgi:hypothetical protein
MAVRGGGKRIRAELSGNDPAAFLEAVVDALRLAAAPPAQQIEALPDFVHVPDEVALLYDDAFRLVPQIREAELIDDDTVQALADLDRLFEEMSTEADRDRLWTLHAMSADERWEKSRQLAGTALATLGRPVAPPRLKGITWVPGGPVGSA